MKYQIDEDVLNKLLKYLQEKPYIEVMEVIPYLQNLEPIPEKKGKK